MSKAVDMLLMKEMAIQDYDEIMFGIDYNTYGKLIDHMCGYNESTSREDPDCGLLFPQPIHEIKGEDEE